MANRDRIDGALDGEWLQSAVCSPPGKSLRGLSRAAATTTTKFCTYRGRNKSNKVMLYRNMAECYSSNL